MKDIKAIRGKFYIQRLIEEGEHLHQDFKFAISDARKIARTISAFANNDGGHLLIGVKDNGVIAGIRTEEDIYVVEQAAQMYCRPEQEVEFTAYNTDGGNVVVKAEVKKSAERPVKAIDETGKWKAYYRVEDENIVAPAIMLKAWQEAMDNGGEFLSLSDMEREILNRLDDGALSMDELIKNVRISRQKAEQLIIKLYSMGIIDFSYQNKEFKLILI